MQGKEEHHGSTGATQKGREAERDGNQVRESKVTLKLTLG